MSGISKSEYIRWVKGSLNRLLDASLRDDGSITPEYRMWIMGFQTNQKLTVNAQVDEATQNALIKRSRYHDGYVRWIQNALLISGEGIRVRGKAIVANGVWGPDTEQAVKDFQGKHEKMKGDGWVGAKTERALMLRTGTVPPGRTKVLRGDPGYIPVFNDDGPLGPAVIPEEDPTEGWPKVTDSFKIAMIAGLSGAKAAKYAKFLKVKVGGGFAADALFFLIWDTENNLACIYVYIGAGIGVGLALMPSVSATLLGPWNSFNTSSPISCSEFGGFTRFTTAGGGSLTKNILNMCGTPAGVDDVYLQDFQTGTTIGLSASSTIGNMLLLEGPDPYRGA